MLVNGIERDYIIHDENNIKGFFGEFRYLSNFEVCDIYFDGDLYGSTEAAYMAGKTTDPKIRKMFSKNAGILPKDARRMGRSNAGFYINLMDETGNPIPIRSDWDAVRYDTMSNVVFDKFYRNLDLREKLLATRDKYIEESNHWSDQFWGVCNGKGESNLGKILMATREFWKAKQKNKDIVTTLF